MEIGALVRAGRARRAAPGGERRPLLNHRHLGGGKGVEQHAARRLDQLEGPGMQLVQHLAAERMGREIETHGERVLGGMGASLETCPARLASGLTGLRHSMP